MSRAEEFVALSEPALRAVTGPNSRHTALIEDAFHVLIESPGGGVSITGSTKDRADAKRAIVGLAQRADAGVDLTEADVRASLSMSGQGKGGTGGQSLISGRRGPIAPKTAAQAAYLDMLSRCDLTFGVGPAGSR